MIEKDLFGEVPPKKTYRAIRHDIVRNRQAKNEDINHHPQRK